MKLSRRDFLKLSGIAAATTATGGLASIIPAAAQDEIVMQWWDHFLPLQPLTESVFAAYKESNPNVTVEYSVFSPPDLGQALQLAYPNDQAPDVHALAGISVPIPALKNEGWFASMEPYITEEWKNSLPESIFIEGRTTFGGELYSFPIFSFRSHEALVWFDKEILAAAGYDPEVGPRTWDEFRDAARKITENGNGTVFGWTQGIGHTERMGATLTRLAQLAGISGDIDWNTGEYAYGADAYVNALEFLVSMERDGSLFPTAITIDTRNARSRWATGSGGLFLDGPWNPGVLQGNFPEFLDKIGVSQAPVPDLDTPSYAYALPKSGDFWISSQSDYPEHAAAILQQFTSEDYQIKLAERMDQPPLDLDTVAKANVHPTYAQCMDFFRDIVRLSPDPLVKNPAVAEVLSRMNDIRPNLGEIVQGVIAGEVSDIPGTLQAYSDQLTAERERAITEAQAEGFEVSQDDWVFSNWDPTADYTSDMYGA
ncbi:MAG: extracellular solute-binding protein [Anaerolineae bacterium]|nr:extracellular solute-binding protein [Anaerolineae bacterium]MCA9890328.1 extracellular solute-binding protein [Anaerolineae bacterium]MCA9892249.1 extracellular solute-binding protein [Anaerolineae bacterium]MCB9459665.1 extracellular solute-binding protein [Anaerolineaceae bacterium]